MTRSVQRRWFLAAILLLVPVVLWLIGWRPNFDPSLELADHWGQVENGTAYDRAVIDLGHMRRIVLPHDAVVRRTPEPGKIMLFMRKTLLFHGWPPEPMSIRVGRHYMGCALKTEVDALVLATFGEWDSHIEGTGRMHLVVVVPEGVEVEQQPGLSGESSAGHDLHVPYWDRRKDAQGGYWYAPRSPAKGWTAVVDMPDPDRTAE